MPTKTARPTKLRRTDTHTLRNVSKLPPEFMGEVLLLPAVWGIVHMFQHSIATAQRRSSVWSATRTHIRVMVKYRIITFNVMLTVIMIINAMVSKWKIMYVIITTCYVYEGGYNRYRKIKVLFGQILGGKCLRVIRTSE